MITKNYKSLAVRFLLVLVLVSGMLGIALVQSVYAKTIPLSQKNNPNSNVVSPGETIRVSVNSNGVQGDNASFLPSVSGDGRFVAFYSVASNLVANDTNGTSDIFVYDIQTGIPVRVSVNETGIEANNGSAYQSISADGRYVAFVSAATNLVPNDINGMSDIFLHDMQTGATTLVSVNSSGIQADNNSSSVTSMSADGRYVSFISSADNLVSNDTNGLEDIFVRDMQTGTVTRIPVGSNSALPNYTPIYQSISANGRYVSFNSNAGNLVSGDTNSNTDVFLYDMQTGVTSRVSVDSNGLESNGQSTAPFVSADGRYVAFTSSATNLVSGDTNGVNDIFVRDTQIGSTTRVSLDSNGVQAIGGDSSQPLISADDRYIVFYSSATNLVSGDTNGKTDVFLRDMQTGETTRISVTSSGVQANGNSQYISMSSDGSFIAFTSYATNLVAGDTNSQPDVFVHQQNTLTTPVDTVTPNGTLTSTPTRTLTPTATFTATSTFTPTATPSQPSTFTPTNMSIPQADLAITKSDGVATYLAGGTVTYTVNVTNLSGAHVIGATVVDMKPANILNWTWTCTGFYGGAGNCTSASNGSSNFSDTVDLPVGGIIVYTVTANIVAVPFGDLVNTATVAAPAGYIDPIPANNTSTDTDTIAVASLLVTKNSSAGGMVNPGDMITYTINITNNGSATLNDIVVSDMRPTGTTYVNASTSATGYIGGIHQNYRDQFDVAQLNNSNGGAAWGGTPWVETGDDGIANTGKIQINTSVSSRADFQATAATDVLTLTRPVNLAGATSATLTYNLAENGVNTATDTVMVQVWNGEFWTTVEGYAGDFNVVIGSINIRSYVSSDTQIRFKVIGFDGDTQNLTLDNVEIMFTGPLAVTKNQIVGGTNPLLINGSPPTLLFPGDSFDLIAGQSMTVTYRVIVNNPVTGGQTQVVNTASVTCNEITTLQQAFVADNINQTPNTATATSTTTNTLTHTPTFTATSTSTVIATSTVNETPTHTPTFAGTNTATSTATVTPTATATHTLTSTSTSVVTPTQAPLLFNSIGAQDGWILESSETSNKGGTLNSTATLLFVGDNAQDKQYKSILSFDTSSLPNNAKIKSVKLKIKVQGFVGGNMFTPVKTLGNLLVDISEPGFGGNANLAVADFQSAASGNAVGVLGSASTGWQTITLKSAAYDFVNLTGKTQFRLRFQKDDNDDLSADYLKIYSGEAPAASRPQLIVEYLP